MKHGLTETWLHNKNAHVPWASPLAPPPHRCPWFGLYHVSLCHELVRRSLALSASRRCWPATRSTTQLSEGQKQKAWVIFSLCSLPFLMGQNITVLYFVLQQYLFSWQWIYSLQSSHLSKVEDEAVSFVEAAPGQLHLLGTDVAFPFDLVQPVHRPRALSPPEARLHTTLLQETRGKLILRHCFTVYLFMLVCKLAVLPGNVSETSALKSLFGLTSLTWRRCKMWQLHFGTKAIITRLLGNDKRD